MASKTEIQGFTFHYTFRRLVLLPQSMHVTYLIRSVFKLKAWLSINNVSNLQLCQDILHIVASDHIQHLDDVDIEK